MDSSGDLLHSDAVCLFVCCLLLLELSPRSQMIDYTNTQMGLA